MGNKTAEEIYDYLNNVNVSKQEAIEAIKSYADQEVSKAIEEDLINFQIYLNDKNLITNYDWDFKKEAKKFIKTSIKPEILNELKK